MSAAGPAPVTAVTLTAARPPQTAPGGAPFPGRVPGSIARPAAPCVTSKNCWSVGDFGTQSGIHQKLLNLVRHWNGTRWSRVLLNNPGGTSANHLNSLFSVRCGSASNCVATGQLGTTTAAGDQTNDEAMRWIGRHWYQTPTPNPAGTGNGHFSQIDGLACAGGADCWGAGNFGVESATLTSQNEILHWNGTKWSVFAAPGT